MSKFTPGPWEVCNLTDVFTGLGAQNNLGIHADDNDGWMVADCSIGITSVHGDYRPLITDEQKANAHLIAAAPEMYEEIDRLSHIIGNLVMDIMQENAHDYRLTAKDIDICFDGGGPEVEVSYKLLAKARGES
jgi:hypothetical protein